MEAQARAAGEQDGAHRKGEIRGASKTFPFFTFLFHLSHPVFLNLQKEGEPGSNQMRKHKKKFYDLNS